MIVSFNWLKKFTNINLEIGEFAKLVGSRLVEVENIIDLNEKYKDAIIVDVKHVEKIEGSDHLNLVKIDDGGFACDINRDDNNLIQVVCGASNIAINQKVVWLKPGSVVPETYGSNSPFVLGTRKLRGYVSNGMIASAKELDLYDDHDGIFVINEGCDAGIRLAELCELDDYLLDIENKSLTHRPDCFGIIGFAREVAGITGQKFVTPNYMIEKTTGSLNISGALIEDIEIEIDKAGICDIYSMAVMNCPDQLRETPLKIKTYLSRSGVRPISPIVDVTNYLMLLTGQPLHAFDYDKLVKLFDGKNKVVVRLAKDGELLKLIDGRNIKLTNSDIVVVVGDKVVSLAGAMGGCETEIDINTKRIAIESATFNLYNLRNTQMRFGIFSEAVTRFTKGQPSGLVLPVLYQAIDMLSNVTGSEIASKVFLDSIESEEKKLIRLDYEKINNILGTNYSYDEVLDVLSNVGFEISNDNVIKIPYWRTDIHIIEDLAEEVGRLKGFDNINPILPTRSYKAIKANDFDSFKKLIRNILTSSGLNEVLSYSFIHGDIMQKIGIDPTKSYRLVNSISPSLQFYRQSITPSLLNFTYNNIKQGFDEFMIYEINKIHSKDFGLNEENVPIEQDSIAAVYSSKKTLDGAAYYRIKTVLDLLFKKIGINVQFDVFVDGNINNATSYPFEPKRSAIVKDSNSGRTIGFVGEYKNSVIKAFKLPVYTSGFEIDLMELFISSRSYKNSYIPVGKYPSVDRDLCFQVEKESVTYDDVRFLVESELKKTNLVFNITPVDIYVQSGSNTKNITIRVNLSSLDHTMMGQEVSEIIDSITSRLTKELNATLV